METCRAFYGPGGWYEKIVDRNIRVVDGHLMAPEGPGIGTALKPEVLQRSDATIEETDEPNPAHHWGGMESPVFEVVGPPGKRQQRMKASWAKTRGYSRE